jgi:Flp pilus assembly pilin Flp
MKYLLSFLSNEDAATIIEYGVIGSFIFLNIVGALYYFGGGAGKLFKVFNNLANYLS